ncbi:MAG: PRC-barrel domain containing protein [Acidimicrobiia bacterium]|nr:PRC-barrel domain containing protein [Acidimicrobiia bacterium]MDQ3501212.1 PRC-barrel domain containing protein [Actinomycetota bacterium]
MRDDLNVRGDISGDMVGYSVEALDGSIGKVDEATHEAGSSYIVVDTGPWIFGKKVLLPAGVVSRVDSEGRSVAVNRTKDQIKNSPEFDDSTYRDSTYRDELGSYYGSEGPGFRDW